MVNNQCFHDTSYFLQLEAEVIRHFCKDKVMEDPKRLLHNMRCMNCSHCNIRFKYHPRLRHFDFIIVISIIMIVCYVQTSPLTPLVAGRTPPPGPAPASASSWTPTSGSGSCGGCWASSSLHPSCPSSSSTGDSHHHYHYQVNLSTSGCVA